MSSPLGRVQMRSNALTSAILKRFGGSVAQGGAQLETAIQDAWVELQLTLPIIGAFLDLNDPCRIPLLVLSCWAPRTARGRLTGMLISEARAVAKATKAERHVSVTLRDLPEVQTLPVCCFCHSTFADFDAHLLEEFGGALLVLLKCLVNDLLHVFLGKRVGLVQVLNGRLPTRSRLAKSRLFQLLQRLKRILTVRCLVRTPLLHVGPAEHAVSLHDSVLRAELFENSFCLLRRPHRICCLAKRDF
mmetsp:Transcript_114388/g.243990  ORF Transcript_114388/g.243990 Transcript_114388/m.243990 type:complete len:246 (+) Transcript_114388:26-763(+)